MKKLLFISLIAVVVMESCSHKIQELPENNYDEQQITAGLAFATKTIVKDADAFDIDFVRMDHATSPSSYNFTILGTGSRAASTNQNGRIVFTGQYYNKNNYQSYFRCFNRLAPITDQTAKTMTWTLDGKSDLLASDVWSAGNYTKPTTSGIEFKHLLSKIEVKCQAKTAGILSAVKLLWGNVTKISVSTNQKIVYNYGNNTFSQTTPINQPLCAGITDNLFSPIAVADFGSVDVTASVMLPPQSTTLSLQITTLLQGVKNIDVTISGGLVAGQIHTITIYFPDINLLPTKAINDQYAYTCSSREW